MTLISMKLSCDPNLFCTSYIYTHTILINSNIVGFNVIRFALHLSRQKTRLVRGHHMHEEIEAIVSPLLKDSK